MVVVVSKLIAVFINIFIIFKVGNKLSKKQFSLFYILTLVFEVFFVLPILLDLTIGYPNLQKYTGFDISQKDPITNIIYCLFIIIVPIIFYFQGRNSNKNINIINIQDICNDFFNRYNLNKLLILILSFLCLMPVWLGILAPNPQDYFFDFAHFYNNTSDIGYEYHMTVMKLGLYIAVFSTLILKAFTNRHDMFITYIILVSVLFVAWFCGKRTLPSLMVMGIIMINIIKLPKGKSIWKQLIIGGILILSFFFLYIIIADKNLVGLDNYDVLRVYFGRDDEVKMTIYSLLYPEQIKILEYPGQSYLFNLTFFIPRELWTSKPWPYAIYFTNRLVGYDTSTYLGWNMTTSWFGEALANFGWFGFVIGVWLFVIFIKISERRNSMLVIIVSLATLSMLMVLQFSANLRYIFIWVTCLLLFKNKKSKREVLDE